MTTHIPVALRREAQERAGECYEYCLLHQSDIFLTFEVDHIVSKKHGGATITENLCLSCPDCNRFKGSDVGSYDDETSVLTPLFNPRMQNWSDHFQLEGVVIKPGTPIGRVTTKLLRLNDIERILDRELYNEVGKYPCRTQDTTRDC